MVSQVAQLRSYADTVEQKDSEKGAEMEIESYLSQIAKLHEFAQAVEQQCAENDAEREAWLRQEQTRVAQLEGVVHDLQVRERALMTEISKWRRDEQRPGAKVALACHLEGSQSEVAQQALDLEGALGLARERVELADVLQQQLQDSEQKRVALEKKVQEMEEENEKNRLKIAKLQVRPDDAVQSEMVDVQRVATYERRYAQLQAQLDDTSQSEQDSMARLHRRLAESEEDNAALRVIVSELQKASSGTEEKELVRECSESSQPCEPLTPEKAARYKAERLHAQNTTQFDGADDESTMLEDSTLLEDKACWPLLARRAEADSEEELTQADPEEELLQEGGALTSQVLTLREQLRAQTDELRTMRHDILWMWEAPKGADEIQAEAEWQRQRGGGDQHLATTQC